jgi:hypothetical protein
MVVSVPTFVLIANPPSVRLDSGEKFDGKKRNKTEQLKWPRVLRLEIEIMEMARAFWAGLGDGSTGHAVRSAFPHFQVHFQVHFQA